MNEKIKMLGIQEAEIINYGTIKPKELSSTKHTASSKDVYIRLLCSIYEKGITPYLETPQKINELLTEVPGPQTH